MIIDNPTSLNGWLINVLEPICDADPQALAKYIMALIKKDKSEDELKKICLDQLEVFLVDETNSFVDILFNTLNNKTYLNNFSDTSSIEQQQQRRSKSPKSHRNVPAPTGSSRRGGYQQQQPPQQHQQNHHHQMNSTISNVNRSPLKDRQKRSRSRSQTRNYTKRNRSRSPTHQENHHHQQQQHYGSNNNNNNNNNNNKKRRCRDYDEKGYCIRGNLCTYDHGINPIVYDTPTVLNSLASSSVSSMNNSNQINHLIPVSNQPQQQSQHYTSALSSIILNEPYNPEPPAIHNSSGLNSIHNQYRPTNHNNVVQSIDQRNDLNKNNIYLQQQQQQLQIEENEPKQQYNNNKSRPNNNRQFKLNQKRKPQSSIENSDKTTLEVRKIPQHQNTIANLNEHFSKFGTITNLKIGYDNDLEAALIQFSSNSEALAAYRSTEAVLNNRFIKVFWHNSSNNNNSTNQNNIDKQTNKDPLDSVTTAAAAAEKKQSIRDRLGDIAEKQASITNTAVSNLINSGLINSNTPNQLAALMLSTGSSVNDKLVSKITPKQSAPISKPVFDKSLLKKNYTPTVSTSATTNTAAAATNSASTTINQSTTATITTQNSTNVENLSTTTTATTATNTATVVTTASSKLNTSKPTRPITTSKINPKSINSNHSSINKQAPNREKLMKKLELQKKRQEMLKTSIQQNKLLVDKLEKAKTDNEKQAILDTLKALSKQIKQLEDDIKRENAAIMEETNLQKQAISS